MNQKRISVVVPTLNEEGNVGELIERTHKALTEHGFVYELIFIDDFSTDSTREIINSYSQSYPVSVHLKQGPKGKAKSLLQGFALAKYEYTAMLDADLQYAPEEIPPMFEKLANGSDIVQSKRVNHKENFIRRFLSKGFSFVFVRILHGLKF
ncbi:MAG TPA: glycosyltransferase family 2 protein, partial [Verrucomicrobiae bacterium]|nr:glycosyltransferase family 2 protein [Verrucomicrobiae bacterium]